MEIIQDNGFRINSKKTKLFRGKSSKQVTGLTVNEFANVPRKLIRSIRQELYLWEKYGYEQATDIIHQRRNYRHKKCPKTLKYLIHGKLLFLSMVRGKGDPTYMRFVRRFRMLEKRDVISSTREAYVCKWEDPEDFWDNKGEEWKFLNSESQMRFKIILDDFPRRSAKHFAGRLEIFLKAGNDLRKKLRTEIGSFCFERLNHIFDIRGGLLEQFTYDRFGADGRCMLDYLLDAEATYLHFLHEDRVERRAHEKFAELFFRVMSVNAEVCSEKLLDPAFEAHLRYIDWGTFFRHQNEEFLARRYGYQKMDAEELVQIAADAERRAMPCASLMLWTALAPMALNAKDEGLASHRDIYRKTLEKYPQFYPIFDDVFTSCTRVRDGRSASLTVGSLRRGVYMLIRALAKRPAGVPVT